MIEEGSHMVMMECPETVNTLLHEFFLWEPDISRKDSASKATADQTATTDAPILLAAITEGGTEETTGTPKAHKPLNK